jgi:hypothetical protein
MPKMISLPRQAWDKHRENYLKKRAAFSDSRSSSSMSGGSAQKEKLMDSLKETVKSVKQVMSSHGLLPDSIAHPAGKAAKLDAATSAARARFLTEAMEADTKSMAAAAGAAGAADGADGGADDSGTDYDAGSGSGSGSGGVPPSYQPILLSAVKDQERRKVRSCRKPHIYLWRYEFVLKLPRFYQDRLGTRIGKAHSKKRGMMMHA